MPPDMPAAKFRPGLAQHHHAPAGHVFATVIAYGFHDGVDAGVAHAETFTGHAVHEHFAAGRAVKRHVADDDVFLGDKSRTFRRINDDFAAAQTLAEIIVGVAFQLNRHALGHERTEALAGAAGELPSPRSSSERTARCFRSC